jgi:FlaA1/EpsC-like NDP-sugar epimerase
LVAVSSFSLFDLYTNFVKLTKKEIFFRTGRAILLMGLTLSAVIYTTRLFNMSRLVLVLFAVFSVIALSLTRILMVEILKKHQGLQ